MKKIILFALDKIAKLKIGNNVALGNGSSICYRKISLKKNSNVSVGSNSLIHGQISFDRECGEICVGNRTFIGNSNLVCSTKITIGDDVMIAWGCTVVDHNSHSLRWSERKDDVVNWLEGKKDWTHVKCASVTIGNKAWIGFNSTILKGVTVGEGAIVAASSVVTRDVPPFTIVAGNPAKVVRELRADER